MTGVILGFDQEPFLPKTKIKAKGRRQDIRSQKESSFLF